MTLRPTTAYRARSAQLRSLNDRLTAELATHRLALQGIVAEGLRLGSDGDAPVDIREGADRVVEKAAAALRDTESALGIYGEQASVLFAEIA